LIHTSKSRCAAWAIATGALLALTGCPNQTHGELMAKVNGYKIYRSEVDKSYNQQLSGSPQKPPAEQEQMTRLRVLQQLISLQLYLQKAEKLGIVATDEDVENRINQAKSLSTKEEFTKRLQEMGFTEEDYRLEIRRRLTIDKLLNKEIASKVTIYDSDIQSYYNEHKAAFNVVETQYHLARIFVSALPNSPAVPIPNKAQNEAQAHDKIRMIHNRLESGEDFADWAAKASEDLDTARSGGELGWIPESQLKISIDPPTRDAIAKLKPGQFSDVVPILNPGTQKVVGYQIVKLLNKEPAGQRAFEDPNVQQQI